MKPAEALQQARALIQNRNHWTYGNHAEDEHHNPVPVDLPQACMFCADGAIARVTGVRIDPNDGEWKDTDAYDIASKFMREAAKELFGVRSHVAVNDGEQGVGLPNDIDDTPTALTLMHANTLRVFDRAIEMARA
jgi:hypothetical protein